MTSETKQLLERWQSLERDGGLQRATAFCRVLWFIGFALFVFVVFAIVYRLHPAVVAISAAALGWVTAERNALRTRASQWPTFKRYIDWQRVRDDLTGDTKAP